jgi:hypothetical protein
MTTATVDDKKRIRLPSAKPGQVFALEEEGGRFVLTSVQKAEPEGPRAHLVKRRGRTYLSAGSGEQMDATVLKELLADFP